MNCDLRTSSPKLIMKLSKKLIMKPISKIKYETYLQNELRTLSPKLIMKPISKINYEKYLQN